MVYEVSRIERKKRSKESAVDGSRQMQSCVSTEIINCSRLEDDSIIKFIYHFIPLLALELKKISRSLEVIDRRHKFCREYQSRS